jgi:PAS domain S-box-containing protein
MNKITSLTEIISIRTLEKIQDNFSQATGIGCVMRNLKGAPVTKFSRPSRLWLEILKHPAIENEQEPVLLAGLDRCLKTGQIQIIQRYLDTYAFIAPMSMDGRILAFLIGGLVRYGNPNIANCAKEAERLGLDLDAYLEMYLELTLVKPEKLEASANLLKIIAQNISSLAREGNEAKDMMNKMATIKDKLEKEVENASLELRESEERYRRLFNTINDGVYEAELDGRIREINPAGAKILGSARNELIGKSLREFYINPGDRDEFMRILMASGHIEGFHAHVRTKDGILKWLETTAQTVKNPNGRISGVQGIFRDISSRSHRKINRNRKDVTAKTHLTGAANH